MEQLDARTLLSATLTDLGTLTGGNVTDVNSGINIVGTKMVSASASEAFLIDSSGTAQNLGIPAGFAASFATGVNATTQVVGYAESTTGLGAGATYVALLFDAGTVSNLGTLGGSSSEAYGINDSGQVVGWADTKSGQVAFLDADDYMTDLGGLPGATASVATAINDAGQIAGYSSVPSGGTGGGGLITTHAFIYVGGTFTDLGVGKGTSSAAYAINNSGQIVGQWDGGGDGTHAFLDRSLTVYSSISHRRMKLRNHKMGVALCALVPSVAV